ncbi:MAG: MFS transporter, partial [Symbiobacteriaceae bacterium]
AVSMQGDGLAGLALIWWIADETGSVGVATLLTLLTMLPVILLGPVAGVLVDRYNRRALMMIADLVRAATALVLAPLSVVQPLGVLAVPLLLWVLAAIRAKGAAGHAS